MCSFPLAVAIGSMWKCVAHLSLVMCTLSVCQRTLQRAIDLERILNYRMT